MEHNMSTSYPKRADHFLQWAKLMAQQAIVPDRVSHKSSKGGKKPSTKRRKRFRKRRKRNRKDD